MQRFWGVEIFKRTGAKIVLGLENLSQADGRKFGCATTSTVGTCRKCGPWTGEK
jgi:hypothetical protein